MKLTKDQVHRFRSLVYSGYNYSELEREFGICECTVWKYKKRLNLLGVKGKYRLEQKLVTLTKELLGKNFNYKEISKKVGISIASVRRIHKGMKKYQPGWHSISDETRRLIKKKLNETDLSLDKIAKECKVSRSYVSSIKEKSNINRPRATPVRKKDSMSYKDMSTMGSQALKIKRRVQAANFGFTCIDGPDELRKSLLVAHLSKLDKFDRYDRSNIDSFCKFLEDNDFGPTSLRKYPKEFFRQVGYLIKINVFTPTDRENEYRLNPYLRDRIKTVCTGEIANKKIYGTKGILIDLQETLPLISKSENEEFQDMLDNLDYTTDNTFLAKNLPIKKSLTRDKFFAYLNSDLCENYEYLRGGGAGNPAMIKKLK